MNDRPLALAPDPDPPVDRLGWRPPRASPWSELARDLWPAFWRGGLAVGVLGLGVTLLVRAALSDLEPLSRGSTRCSRSRWRATPAIGS